MLGVMYQELKRTFDSPEEFCELVDEDTYKRILERGFVGIVSSTNWNLLDLHEYMAREIIEKIYERRRYGKKKNDANGITKFWENKVGSESV